MPIPSMSRVVPWCTPENMSKTVFSCSRGIPIPEIKMKSNVTQVKNIYSKFYSFEVFIKYSIPVSITSIRKRAWAPCDTREPVSDADTIDKSCSKAVISITTSPEEAVREVGISSLCSIPSNVKIRVTKPLTGVY